MARPDRSFEAVWARIQQEIAPSDTIRNWTRDKGYLGDDFTIHAVQTHFVEVDSPGAADILRVHRGEFAKVYEYWDGYNARVVRRRKLADITHFAKYVISILHHVLNRA